MEKIKISKQEFEDRIIKIREKIKTQGMDALFVYGDEYRKENLRYVSNYWPIFERGAMLLGKLGKRNRDLLLQFLDKYAREMPRTMLRYSIEKLTDEERKHYMPR